MHLPLEFIGVAIAQVNILKLPCLKVYITALEPKNFTDLPLIGLVTLRFT